MSNECPSCGHKREPDSAVCAHCGADATAFDGTLLEDGSRRAGGPTAAARPPEQVDVQTFLSAQSNIERSGMTISQFMREQELEGVIDLDSDDASTASKVLTADQGRKYELGSVVATGGMGAIVDAKDVNTRRHVAMKVLLDPRKATKERVLRFIQEAQITAQLEHPAIVPLHELGVDSSGNVFYTMKMIQGITLKDILKRIGQGDTGMVHNYPLSRLLTIFQRVCDSVAFAHSRDVIHRDLKPENVMVGDYGEVVVMDWGLAKVLMNSECGNRNAEPEMPAPAAGPAGEPQVSSVRDDEASDVLVTLDGAIMGTPGFMAPEQALGRTDELDERADIYSLGAILYNILTLRPPVMGRDLGDVLAKATTGRITPPTDYNTKTRFGRRAPGKGDVPPDPLQSAVGPDSAGGRGQPAIPLVHCPAERIPESLSAVAMKALSLEADDRYESVKHLQEDVEAYQNGFATQAESASLWRHIQLFFARHKVVASLTAGIVFLVLIGGVTSTIQWLRVEKAKAEAEQNAREARDALARLRGTAPDLVAVSNRLVDQHDLEGAVEKAGFAAALVPESAEYRVHLADLLQASLRLDEAIAMYERALELDPDQAHARRNRDLSSKIRKEHGDELLNVGAAGPLFMSLVEQDRVGQALAMVKRLNPEAKSLDVFYRKLLSSQGVKIKALTVDGDGLCNLAVEEGGIADLGVLKGVPLKTIDLAGTAAITDLSPLKGMPLRQLKLGTFQQDCPMSDLSPLKGMSLEVLSLERTAVRDLSILQGMPIRWLSLWNSRHVSDLEPLRGMPLGYLRVRGCTAVKDLSPLKGAPLKVLDIGLTAVKDLSPLKDLPLKSLEMRDTKVTSLKPLEDMALEALVIEGCDDIREFTPLQGMTSLEVLTADDPSTLFLGTLNRAVSRGATAEVEQEAARIVKLWSDVPALAEVVQQARRIGRSVPVRLAWDEIEMLLATDVTKAEEKARVLIAKWQNDAQFLGFVRKAESALLLAALGKNPGQVPPMAKTFEGHHYALYPVAMTWDEARALCESAGGHLVTITSKEENAFVFSLVGGQAHYFLGCLGRPGGEPQWITGEPWTFGSINWAHPSDPYAGVASMTGVWNLNAKTHRAQFVIEWE